MTDLAPRDLRTGIATMAYTGTESLGEALTVRQRMAATVELAKRAGIDAREHMWNAREAERALGRMILAAREAGDLAGHGGDRKMDAPHLADLGIDPHLAAHAVRVAKIPDETWQDWHGEDIEPTQRAIDSAAKEYERRVTAEGRRRAEAEAAVAEAEADIERRTAEMEQLAAQAREFTETVAAPPLLPAEVDTSAAELVLPVLAPEPMPKRDRIGDDWTALFRRITALRRELEAGPRRLPNDLQADVTVLAARDVARSMTAAVAAWTRRVNDLYATATKEG